MSIFQKALDSTNSILHKTQESMDNIVNKTHVSLVEQELAAHKKQNDARIDKLIGQFKTQRDSVYAQVGKLYYEAKSGGNEESADFTELFSILDEQKTKIAEQEKIKAENAKKYDEALALLESGVKDNDAIKVTAASCPVCGQDFSHGLHMFCSGCGEDLRKPLQTAEESSGILQAEAEADNIVSEITEEASAEVAVAAAPCETEKAMNKCTSCGTEYNPEIAIFCKNCGKNLKETE